MMKKIQYVPLRKGQVDKYDCSFFPISKVFIGAKMSGDNRMEIIKICNDQKIPSICVLPAPSVFSMEECPSKMNNPNCTYKKLVD